MNRAYVYLLSVAHLATDMSPGALPALLPFFVLYYHLSYTEVAGLMFASASLSSAIQPFFGLLADKMTKHWLMGFGVLLTGIALGSTAFTTNYWLIFAAVIFMGMGSSIFHPQAARFVNLISGDQKSTGVGIFSVGGNAGFGIAPLLAVWAVTLWGLKGVTLFALISFVLGGALLFIIPSLERVANECRKKENKHHSNEGTNDWRSFIRLTFVIIGRSIVFCTLSAFMPLFCIAKFGVSEAFAGTTLTVFAFGCTIMTLVGGWLGDKIGLVKTMRLGALILIPSIALLAFSQNIWWMFATLLIASFGINAPYAAFVVLGQTYLAKNIGFASGVTLGLSFSIGGIFVPILGALADRTSLQVVMYVLIALSALCALGAYMLKEPTK